LSHNIVEVWKKIVYVLFEVVTAKHVKVASSRVLFQYGADWQTRTGVADTFLSNISELHSLF
jgi:hypothetical protein